MYIKLSTIDVVQSDVSSMHFNSSLTQSPSQEEKKGKKQMKNECMGHNKRKLGDVSTIFPLMVEVKINKRSETKINYGVEGRGKYQFQALHDHLQFQSSYMYNRQS